MTKDKTHPETVYVGYYFAQGDGIVHSLVQPDHERAVEYIRADLCPKSPAKDEASAAQDGESDYTKLNIRLKIKHETIKALENSLHKKHEALRAAVGALEIAIGYAALVADRVRGMPITKKRAQSDCEVIGQCIAQIEAILKEEK